jgi:hypothetical protein
VADITDMERVKRGMLAMEARIYQFETEHLPNLDAKVDTVHASLGTIPGGDDTLWGFIGAIKTEMIRLGSHVGTMRDQSESVEHELTSLRESCGRLKTGLYFTHGRYR